MNKRELNDSPLINTELIGLTTQIIGEILTAIESKTFIIWVKTYTNTYPNNHDVFLVTSTLQKDINKGQKITNELLLMYAKALAKAIRGEFTKDDLKFNLPSNTENLTQQQRVN